VWNLSVTEHASVHMAYRRQTGGRWDGALLHMVSEQTRPWQDGFARQTYRFMAAKYRYLCIMGTEG
jgi:hypothetical protein